MTGWKPLYSNHNFLLVMFLLEEVLWCFVDVQPLCWMPPVIIKIHFSSHVPFILKVGYSCSAKEGQTTPQNYDFFDYPVPIYCAFLTSLFASNSKRLLIGRCWVLQQLLVWFCKDGLQFRLNWSLSISIIINLTNTYLIIF